MKKVIKKLLTSKKLRTASMLAITAAVTANAVSPTAAWS